MDAETSKQSIAHFYRDCEVWPRLDPSTILAPALWPLRSKVAQPLPLGDKDRRITLNAAVHRSTWVAGQRCYLKIHVNNESKKPIKKLTITLVRTMTVFRSQSQSLGLSTRPKTTTHKEVAEAVLDMAQRGTKGRASTKGWFSGVESGQSAEFMHGITLPVSRSYIHGVIRCDR